MPSKSATKIRETSISPERLEAMDLHRVMSMIPIMPYHTVADIASDTGHFVIPLAKYVFEGKVYALGTEKEALDTIKDALEKLRLSNTETVLNKTKKLQLDDKSIDGVLVPFVFSSGEDTASLLKEIYRVLFTGGWMAVLEWNDAESSDAPAKSKRVSDTALRKVAEKAKFRFTASYHLDKDQYMLLMRK